MAQKKDDTPQLDVSLPGEGDYYVVSVVYKGVNFPIAHLKAADVDQAIVEAADESGDKS